MTAETISNEVVQDLGETDRLLVETSSLPEEVRTRIANRLKQIKKDLHTWTLWFGVFVTLSVACLLGLAGKWVFGQNLKVPSVQLVIIVVVAFPMLSAIYWEIQGKRDNQAALRQKLCSKE